MVFIVVTLTFHFFQNLLFMNSVSLSKYYISLLFIFTPTLPLLLAIYLFYLLRLLVFIVQQILSKSSLFYCNWYFFFHSSYTQLLIIYYYFSVLPSPSLSETKFVGNKAKGRMAKRVLQGKKLSEKRTFLTPDTYKHVCTPGGKKYSFFGKFDVLCFLVKLALRFTLLPYYRRINPSMTNTLFI